MLLNMILVIFGACFALIKFNNKPVFFDSYLKDLTKSIAMYARTTGHLPHAQNHSIPWEEIGISSTFFNINSQTIKYSAAIKLLDKTLTPIDLKLVETNHEESNFTSKLASTSLRTDSLENQKLDAIKRHSIAYMPQNSVAFEISAKDLIVSINIETLAQMANYPLFIAKLDENIVGMPIYLKDSIEWQKRFYSYY